VANRVAGTPGEVLRRDFEAGIGARLDLVLPEDRPAAARAQAQATALALVAGRPLARALGSLAARLRPGAAPPPRGGWRGLVRLPARLFAR
jgi:Flp pilus assembly CpaE family ATPase